jgi:hypothetical protein
MKYFQKQMKNVITENSFTSRSFRVFVFRKVPYLSGAAFTVAMICFAVFFLFDILAYPAKFLSLEMKVITFHLLVPSLIKKILLYSVIGLVCSVVFVEILKYKKPALLILNENEIVIKAIGFNRVLPIKKIENILINNATDKDGFPKAKLTVQIQQKRRNLKTSFRLMNYEQIDELLECISRYSDVRIKYFEAFTNLTETDEPN